MRTVNQLKRVVSSLFWASCFGLSITATVSAGQLWFGGSGPTNATSSGASDDRVGYINTDGTALGTVATDSSTNSFYCVALDTNANLYFALASDGTLHSGFMNSGPTSQSFSGTGLSSLIYIGALDDSVWVSGTSDYARLYTADASNNTNADSPSVYVDGPFGTLNTFNSSYELLADNVPAGTSPYWVVWVSPPNDTNEADQIAIVQDNVGSAFNDYTAIHVYDPNGVLGSYEGESLAELNTTAVPPSGTFTFGQMTVAFAGIEIGDWGVSTNTSASADIESMSFAYAVSGLLNTIQITDVAASDLAYSMAVDPSHQIIYLGLWGNDASGADLIEIPYNPADGQMTSPYDPTNGSISDESGVLLSFESTDLGFVMARQMWVAPGGGQIYYVDDDFGDPGDFADNVHQNGVYAVDTAAANPQPQLLNLPSQFPNDYSEGYIVGLAVNTPLNLIYFATSGPAPGVGTASNTIWSMPITGGAATAMPLPEGFSLVFPNYAGGCMALDSKSQNLYVSDEGRGSVMKLALAANGLSFSGGDADFFTLDTDNLTNGPGGYPSAFVQGLAINSTGPAVAPPPPQTRLTIMRQGSGVVVSWPMEYSNYTLQYSSGLVTNAWSAFPGPFGTNSATISTTNAISAKETFFRLFY
jgi:hypothetical protein